MTVDTIKHYAAPFNAPWHAHRGDIEAQDCPRFDPDLLATTEKCLLKNARALQDLIT